MTDYLFTSESVSEGHPDKVADQISDAVLDAYLAQDSNAKVACETLVTRNLVVVAGEVHSAATVDAESVVRNAIQSIGYTDDDGRFNDRVPVDVRLHAQAAEIRQGVDGAAGEIGAGDQGLMFGYAVDETPELMPLPILLAHRLVALQAELRKSGKLAWLLPDGKSQVTVRYVDGRPSAVETVVLSTQHRPGIGRREIEEGVVEEIIKSVIPETLRSNHIRYFVNPTGSFIEGGPATDTGLTGRKIIVDTYGGSCPHGGGAFSGKDPTKVDRSAAYAVRYVAKNVVAAGLAKQCTVQVSYVIGGGAPISFHVDTHGTAKITDSLLGEILLGLFDLRPAAVIDALKLRRPIYLKTAAYGHFGRELREFTWEGLEKQSVLQSLVI
ncbi:MAG: methionine adenosyltransferase [Bacteroidota bacterium]